jgi:hypothetical protein
MAMMLRAAPMQLAMLTALAAQSATIADPTQAQNLVLHASRIGSFCTPPQQMSCALQHLSVGSTGGGIVSLAGVGSLPQ